MYELIERLVLSNSLLLIDKRELDIEDLMQAERIKNKKTKAAKEADLTQEGGDFEFEGGGQKRKKKPPQSDTISEIYRQEVKEIEQVQSTENEESMVKVIENNNFKGILGGQK